MGRYFLVVALVGCLAAVLAAPAGSGGENPPEADGLLVMGVAGGKGRTVTREQAVVADPRTGAVRARRLAGGTLCHGPLLAVGGQAVFSGYRRDQSLARALPLDLDGPARSLGPADAFTRSPTPGLLWLVRWRHPHGGVPRWSDRPLRMTLREVDGAGRVRTRTDGLLPRFGSLDAATTAGFVGTEGRWLTLRQPGRDRPLMRVRDGWFAAAGRSSFAWCRGRCGTLHVSSGARDRPLKPPAGITPAGPVGAFSPDEQRLAAGVTVGGRDRLAVVDLRTGHWMLVAGGKLGGYRAIAWSPSGAWLYFTASNRRLLGWRFGTERAMPLPIVPGGTVMSIATAEPGR